MNGAYIFLCSDSTEDECLRLNLFGGTEKYKSKVKSLQVGDTLFLYNYKSKRLQGKFIATSELQSNIDTTAWEGDFPLQVSVKQVNFYKPITKIDFEKVVSFFNGKPQARLSVEQAEKLDEIFKSDYRSSLAEEDYRKINEATISTLDGHWVRSRGEKLIDNWLFNKRIIHCYEVSIKEGYCDFLIPAKDGDIYIEYWGMDDEDYKLRKERKLKIYKEMEVKLIQVFHKDLKTLDNVLSDLLKYSITECYN